MVFVLILLFKMVFNLVELVVICINFDCFEWIFVVVVNFIGIILYVNVDVN